MEVLGEKVIRPNPEELHQFISSIDWSALVSPSGPATTCKVKVVGDKIQNINKGLETKVTVKHAIQSRIPADVSVAFEDPDLSVTVRLSEREEGDMVSVSVMADLLSSTSTCLLRDYR